jgi:hypothetical protein
MTANMIVLDGFDTTLTRVITDGGSPDINVGTDYGYDDINNTSMDHTFVIVNQPTDTTDTTSTVGLVGSPPVVLSGDTTDFTLTAQPTNTTIAASSGVPSTSAQYTYFDIVFKPLTAGLHTATVTIASSDPNHPNFTINLSGSGAAFTTLPSGTEYFTTVAGSGTPASTDAAMTVTYTGYQPNGIVFDSTAKDGGTPFSLTLGIGSVIPGWDLGLLGILPGETRTLIIPSDQAYGDDPTGGQPAGQLVFTVTANTVTGAIGPNFLNNLYQDVLGRAADSGGTTYWNNQIYQYGASPATVVSNFINSQEYRTNRITALYTSVLSRSPDTSGLNYWLSYLAAGNTVEQMEAQFYGSAEFANQHGNTTTGTITGLYQVLLGRAPDTAGLAYWVGVVNGGDTVAQVAYSIIRAPEGQTVTVTDIYTKYLNRQPDSAGLAYWTSQLALPGASETDIISGIMSAAEFYTA